MHPPEVCAIRPIDNYTDRLCFFCVCSVFLYSCRNVPKCMHPPEVCAIRPIDNYTDRLCFFCVCLALCCSRRFFSGPILTKNCMCPSACTHQRCVQSGP